ncbi:MAG: Mfa1 fimbrilin C-terminal domain-containing protein [Muribaculaceae bacterium]|nr:Mfa1 fimbrilin C-terminal domain-containing protein [Muribaculaceae bacterium]
MKKILFLFTLLALCLASCRHDETDVNSGNTNRETATFYLAINLSEPQSAASRADNDSQDEISPENIISSIRFFFFDDSGSVVKIKSGDTATINYFEWEPEGASQPSSQADPSSDEDDSEGLNMASSPSVLIELDAANRGQMPKWVIAVANSKDSNHDAIESLENLRGLTGIYDVSQSNPYCVMSNTVYADPSSKTLFDAVEVSGNITRDKDEARRNPLEVSLERVTAKVNLSLSSSLESQSGNITLSDGSVLYYTGVEDDSAAGSPSDSKVYAKFLGWNLTCIPSKTFLVKHINPEWNNTDVFGSDSYNWNSTSNKRSFWAINPSLNYADGENGDYLYGDFNNAKSYKGFGSELSPAIAYTRENASENELLPTAHPTQLIVAAQLVNSKGEALEIAQMGTNHYTKQDLLTSLSDLANVYEVTKDNPQEGGDSGNSGATKYTKLDARYFKFVSARDAGKTTEDGGLYNAYLQLDPEAIKDKSLAMVAQGDIMEANDINQALVASLPPVKIWTEGHTYYYIDIRHLDLHDNNGTIHTTLGVVRNHVYNIKISSIRSLGTPVFKDDEVIIPETPDGDENFMAAEINTVIWRHTSKNIQLEW